MLLAQIQEQPIQQFRLLLHRAVTDGALARADSQSMGLICPVGPNPDVDRGHSDLRVGLNRLIFHSMMQLASRKDLGDRKPYRGPIKRQPLSVRIAQKQMAGSESLSRCITDMGRVIRHPSRVTPLLEAQRKVVHKLKVHGGKSYSHRLRRAVPAASSPMLNNFWNSYKGQGEGGFYSSTHPAY